VEGSSSSPWRTQTSRSLAGKTRRAAVSVEDVRDAASGPAASIGRERHAELHGKVVCVVVASRRDLLRRRKANGGAPDGSELRNQPNRRFVAR
jgi:hypothetical protein